MGFRHSAYVFAFFGLAALFSGAAFGQQAAQGKTEFDVASVKPAAPPTGNVVMRRMTNPDPGMVKYTNVTLKMLIAAAYEVKEFQISGPDWLNGDGFDVQAKIPAGASKEQIPLMLQALLADRFKLAIHREQRSLNVYALVIGKNGPKLKEVDAETLKAQAAAAASQNPADPPPPPPPPGPGGLPERGKGPSGPGLMMMMTNTGARQVRGQTTLAKFSNLLSNLLDRPVLDMTGLNGTYEIDMVWAADERENNQMGKMIVIGGPPPSRDSGSEAKPADSASAPAATIFTAVQDALGLRLEARKSDAEFLVIDRAEKTPTEN